MLEPIIESLHAFFVMISGYEMGTTEFYVSAGSALAVTLVVARLLAGLFGSSKGIVATAIAAFLPLFLGAIGYVSVELYALPNLEAAWAATYLPWTVCGVVVLLVAFVVSAKLWRLGAGSAVVALVLAGFAGIVALYTAQLIIEVLDSGSSQVEKRDERFNLEIENTN